MTSSAQILSEELSRLGVKHFFLVTGGDNALWVRLAEKHISHILARSEAAAVYMADGYARVSRQASFVYGQYGPGAANIAGSLAEPMWSSSPVVALTSAMRRHDRYWLEYQDLDQLTLFAAVTKWQAEVTLPEQIPHVIRTAVLHAISGNPGPVYVGIPSDITAGDLGNPAKLPGPQSSSLRLRVPIDRPRPQADVLRLAVERICMASRPIVLAGNGVHASEAYAELLKAVERLGIPVLTSLSGKGVLSEKHRLAGGPVGRYSRTYGNQYVTNADLVIAIGSSLGGLVTDSYRSISDGCSIVQVDIDPSVIGHNFTVDVPIHADAREFLRDLYDSLEPNEVAKREPQRAEWAAQIETDRAAWRSRLSQVDTAAQPMRPEAVITCLSGVLPGNSLLVADTGYAAAWSGAIYEVPEAGRHFLRADGSLGWAFPAALGAKLANPARPVVVVTGDGGFGYHLAELETAVRLRLPVITVVLNNHMLAFETHVQKLFFRGAIDEANNFTDVDYAAVARSFGAEGHRVSNVDDLKLRLAQGLSADHPVVIDAVIDEDAIAPVTRFDSVRTRNL